MLLGLQRNLLAGESSILWVFTIKVLLQSSIKHTCIKQAAGCQI